MHYMPDYDVHSYCIVFYVAWAYKYIFRFLYVSFQPFKNSKIYFRKKPISIYISIYRERDRKRYIDR